MAKANVTFGCEAEGCLSENEQLAHTWVRMATRGNIAGAFAVTNPTKPMAGQVVSYLHSMGISTIMVTGDN